MTDGPSRRTSGFRGWSPRSSAVAVEATRAEEQPGQPVAQASRALRRIHGSRVELQDDRTEDRLERRAEAVREVELSPGVRLRTDPVPTPSQEGVDGGGREDSRGHPP